MPYNHHYNYHIVNPTYYTIHSSRDASYTFAVRPTSKLCNHCCFTNRKALHSEHSIDSNFPHDSYHHAHNPSKTIDCQETASIEQLSPVVNEASLLALVMVEQPITQEVISSMKTFDGTKCKFQLWIASAENAA